MLQRGKKDCSPQQQHPPLPLMEAATGQGRTLKKFKSYLWTALVFLTSLLAIWLIFSSKVGAEGGLLYDFKARDILDQKDIDFGQFRGKVVVIVNVASRCALARSNYEGLAELLDQYYNQGLRIILFPCNQFLKQEPDSPEKIKEFAESYNKKFIITQRVNVNGSSTHPLWKWLKSRVSGLFFTSSIKWNYTKVSFKTWHYHFIISFIIIVSH